MEEQLLKGLTQLGPFGLLAAFIFYTSQKNQKAAEDRIAKLSENLLSIVEGNTAAMTKLCTLVEQLSARSISKGA